MFASKQKQYCCPTRVSIEEANAHLQLVHSRVEQLEGIIDKQTNDLIEKHDYYQKQVKQLRETNQSVINRLENEIQFLKNRVKGLEQTVDKQNIIITENKKNYETIKNIIKLAPNLEKLFKLLNNITINDEINNYIKTEQLNGFLANDSVINHKNRDKKSKKSIKHKSDDNLYNNYKNEDIVSISSSIGSGQSQDNSSVRKHSNSKLNISKSFNITSNFSDDEDCGQSPDCHSVKK